MANILGYNMPDDLYYHREHAWVKLNDDGTVTIGMNEFYYKLAGETTYIDLPMEDDEVSQDETCGKIQSSKWVGKFVSPLSGEITTVNEALEDDCTILDKDPYGDGWIMKLKPSNLEEELKGLYHGGTVESWIKKEIEDAEKKKEG